MARGAPLDVTLPAMPLDQTQARRRRIEQAMARAGYESQAKIAAAIGVIQATVSEVLTGRRPGLPVLKKIAEKTGVTFEWLRWGDADKAPPWATATEIIHAPRRANEPVRDYVTSLGNADLDLLSPAQQAVVLVELSERLHQVIDQSETLLAAIAQEVSALVGSAGPTVRPRAAQSLQTQAIAQATEQLQRALAEVQLARDGRTPATPTPAATTVRRRRRGPA